MRSEVTGIRIIRSGQAFTQRRGTLPPRRAHPSLLLLAEKPADGGLDALLLGGLVERILAAVGAAAAAAAVPRQAGRDEGKAVRRGGAEGRAKPMGRYLTCGTPGGRPAWRPDG